MLSSSKLAALRLSLQPLTCFATTPTNGPTPTPLPYTPATLPTSAQSQQQPKKIRLTPVPDSLLCSPTPTRAAFLLTPTRFTIRTIATVPDSACPSPFLSPIDPTSPMLSTCICEDCENPVLSERNTCSSCREVFFGLLASTAARSQLQMRSPSQSSSKRSIVSPGFMHVDIEPNHLATHSYSTAKTTAKLAVSSETGKPILSAAHPRPEPVEDSGRTDAVNKVTRKPEEELQDPASPDALYFGKRRRRNHAVYSHRQRPLDSFVLTLKTSVPMQKVQDEEMSP